jgi:hypothetical protein
MKLRSRALAPLLLLSACLASEERAGSPDDDARPGDVASLASLASLSDADGDGYDGADCDDGDAAVHPNLEERANGVDDNCDGAVDEPTLRYAVTRPLETQATPQLPSLTFWISDSATRAYLDHPLHLRFGYRLIYQRLSSASGLAIVSPIVTTDVLPRWTRPAGSGLLRIDPNAAATNLAPLTVYRMKLQLYTAAGLPLGAQSDWFYSVTAGSSAAPSDALKWGRVDLALRALDQLGDSQAGLVGGGGTVDPDGSRYTASALTPLHPHYNGPGDDRAWCDWFFHYVGVRATDGLDGIIALNPVVDGGNAFWHEMNPNNVPNAFRDPELDGCGTEVVDLNGNGIVGDVLGAGCQKHSLAEVMIDSDDNEFYSNIVTNSYYHATRSLPQNQGLGNYQAMDHHAGMFLAFDPNGDGSFSGSGTVGTLWSIEGNVGNRVAIMHRPADSTTINGFGKLNAAMFSP